MKTQLPVIQWVSNDTEILHAIADAMEHEPTLAEFIEQRVDYIVRELDELCAMAINPNTADLVEAQKIGIGQIITSAHRVETLLLARTPAGLRIIKNG